MNSLYTIFLTGCCFLFGQTYGIELIDDEIPTEEILDEETDLDEEVVAERDREKQSLYNENWDRRLEQYRNDKQGNGDYNYDQRGIRYPKSIQPQWS